MDEVYRTEQNLEGESPQFNDSQRKLITTGLLMKGSSMSKGIKDQDQLLKYCYGDSSNPGFCDKHYEDMEQCKLKSKSGNSCIVRGCEVWKEELYSDHKCLYFTGADQYIKQCYEAEGLCTSFDTEKCLIKGEPTIDEDGKIGFNSNNQ